MQLAFTSFPQHVSPQRRLLNHLFRAARREHGSQLLTSRRQKSTVTKSGADQKVEEIKQGDL